MYDPTPAPLGDITRRWSLLSDDDRAAHADRLLGRACRGPHRAHVARPGLDGGVCYAGLIGPAVAGDPIALGWLATTHRPMFVARGRALLESDPAEWGSACLEALHVVMSRIDASAGRWVRRRAADRLASHLGRTVRRHVARCAHESVAASAGLRSQATLEPPGAEPHLDLTLALDRTLAWLDVPTREALQALADREPMAAVAARHGLTHDAVRQRVTRARRRLQPMLAGFQRQAA